MQCAEKKNMKKITSSHHLLYISIPANASDSVYCIVLSQNAVYGAMAGFTGFVVGLVNTHYCYIPIRVVTSTRKVDTTGGIILLCVCVCVCVCVMRMCVGDARARK